MSRRAPARHRRAAALALVGIVVALVTACASSGARDLSGDLAVHDPAYAVSGDTQYVYSTGNASVADGGIQIRSSSDGTTWRYRGEVWTEKPAWLSEAVPGVTNLWAPELVEHEGTWYLYYSASTFGSNTSVIALATNATLDPDDPDYEWVDRGEVVASSRGDDFNAIDPGIVVDDSGEPWMAFGSFWSGIRMVPLAWPDGLRADDAEPLRLADRSTVRSSSRFSCSCGMPRDGPLRAGDPAGRRPWRCLDKRGLEPPSPAASTGVDQSRGEHTFIGRARDGWDRSRCP